MADEGYIKSRIEDQLEAIINDDSYSSDYIQSRNELILQSIIDDTPYTAEPQSRIEVLLLQLKEKIEQGGGGNYEEKTVTPNFSSGNVLVEPDEGYDALSSVTVQKDNNLIAGNIKLGISVFGITGSFADQSGGIVDGSCRTFSNNEVTWVRKSAFYGLTALQSVSLPAVKNIINSAFSGCTNLQSVELRDINRVYPNSFDGCKKLAFIDLKNCSTIDTNAFTGCTTLGEIVIRKNSVCTLGGTNSLNQTPFDYDGSGGILYVPENLIPSYQGASNWATILGYAHNQIKKIEGSIYE